MQLTDERKKRVIDLYFNQHKSYAEIAQIEKMSPRGIHTIIKEEESRRQKYKQQEISAQAYQLFSEGKTPVEVAIVLNLRAPEVTRLYREYWELKRLHTLNSVYKETNGKLWPFLKLYRLMKEKGMNIEQVVNAVDIAIHKLPYMEGLYKQLKDEVDKMQRTRQQLENYLHKLKEEIASAKSLLNSYHTLCERKRQELENINSEVSRIVTLVNRFKNNNEEYPKIENIVEEKVKSVLTDNKQILQFALASVIEAIRRNPDKYNSLIFNDTSASSTLTSIPAQGSILSHIEDYRDMILEEAKRLYDSLLHHFTNSIMDNTVPK
jgi:archaellum component FlaC